MAQSPNKDTYNSFINSIVSIPDKWPTVKSSSLFREGYGFLGLVFAFAVSVGNEALLV